MKTIPVGDQQINFINSFKAKDEKKKDKSVTIPNSSEQNTNNEKKYMPLITTALAITSLGVSIYALKGKGNGGKSEVVTDGKAALEEAINNAKEECKNVAKEAVNEVKTKVETNEAKIRSNQIWNDGYLNDLSSKIEDIKSRPTQVQAQIVMDRNWAWGPEGMRLRKNTDNAGARKPLSVNVINKLRENANKFITGQNLPAVAALTASSVVWLPSAETKPEKEGGLGEVPVQMATNFVKEYGIEESYIPRPLIEIPGKSYIKEVDGKWEYWYDGLKNEKGEDIVMKVDKVAEYETTAYHNGQANREKVEVFYGIDPVGGYKRLMFRNPNYFAADGLYVGTESAEEPERYTFFDRALYDFMKLVKDPKSVTYAKLEHPNLFKTIKAPDAIVLNDWHVAPLAALMRTLAPVEAANKKLNSSASNDFENMNLMYLVHNADYQGQEFTHRDDILNTLFGQYALDIVENAKTGFYEEYTDEYGNKQQRPIGDLKSPFMIQNNVNMANMAMSYSNIVKPVSRTYAKEMAEQNARSMGLRHISNVRIDSNTMVGQSNGWDRTVNEVSQANLPGFNNNLNKDIFTIFRHSINSVEGLTTVEKDSVRQVFAEFKDKINVSNFDVIYAKLDRLNIPALDNKLKELKDAGLTELRSFHRATCDMPEAELLEARKHNKRVFFEHVKSMIDYDKTHDKKLFNIKELENTDLSSIDPEKLDEVPFFNMGVRFVAQKGVDIVSEAWVEILSKWDELYPGKPRPFVNIGGADGSANGIYRGMIKDAKDRLGEKGNTFVQWEGFVPNNILMAGSDYTMRPSHFEPDGDKWESLYKGTPMVMTRVGGHIDSIKDEFNGFLTSRTVPEIERDVAAMGLTGEAFDKQVLKEKIKDYVEAIKKSLDTFYNADKQNQMVVNSIKGNQSWVIKENGKIVECASLAHLRDLGFDLSTFPQVDSATYQK